MGIRTPPEKSISSRFHVICNTTYIYMYLLVVQIFHGGSRWSKVTRKQYPLSNDCIGGTLGSLIPNTKYTKYTRYTNHIPNTPIISQIHHHQHQIHKIVFGKYTILYVKNTNLQKLHFWENSAMDWKI